MSITGNYETLMRQAPDTADVYLRAAIRNIDSVFGEGYASKHPELVAAMVNASGADFNTSAFIVALQEASTRIADALERMGSQ